MWPRACWFSWIISSTLSTPIKWLVSFSAISSGRLTYHRYPVLRTGNVVSTFFRRSLRVTCVVNKSGENQTSKAEFQWDIGIGFQTVGKRRLSRLPLAYLTSQGFWKGEQLEATCSDQTTCVHEGEGKRSPGNTTGLPGEKAGGHPSCTHLIHPGERFVTSGKKLAMETLYQPKYWS